MKCTPVCVFFTDLVVSKGHAAAHTLLHADMLQVSGVTVPRATGLGDDLIGVEEPEETLLEVLGSSHAAAIELYKDRHTTAEREREQDVCKSWWR